MSRGQRFPGPGEDREKRREDDGFADVLNAFSFAAARRRRKKRGPDSPPAETGEEASQNVSRLPFPRQPRPPEHQRRQAPRRQYDGRGKEAGEQPPDADPSGTASIVRAYAWTGGRTRSEHHFEIETLVTASRLGRRSSASAQPEYRSVIALCQEPLSVAEVAALLSIPLAVAKVLLGDMAKLGLIDVHCAAVKDGESPDGALLERVLSGLRKL
jgi:hypothetical protein